jgi:hypothetical protein
VAASEEVPAALGEMEDVRERVVAREDEAGPAAGAVDCGEHTPDTHGEWESRVCARASMRVPWRWRGR